MAFFDLFTKNSNYPAVQEIFSQHEEASQQNLESKHPHVKALFPKHGIDLKKIRHKKAKTLAAASALGAMLAFPHLVSAPTRQPIQPQNVLVKDLSTNKADSPSNDGPKPAEVETSLANKPSLSANNSPNTVQPSSQAEGQVNPDNDHQDHQSHQHGRDYLAPPKQDQHDLDHREGEEKDHSHVKGPGSHPEEKTEHSKGEI